MSKNQFENGYREANPRGSITFNKKEIIIPANITAGGILFRFTAHVNAAAAASGGMSTAAQQALLKGLNLTFRTDVSNKDRTRTPIDKETFFELAYDSRRILEREMLGGVGDTTGLKKALVEGANLLTFEIPVSIAHVQFMNDAGELFGLGAPQLLDCDMTLKVDPEMLKAIDTNVTLTKIGVDFRIIEQEDAEGDREGLVPSIVEVKGGEENRVEGPDGLTLSVEHTAKPLTGGGASTIQVVTVTVGGDVVAQDPATPSDIQAAYDQEPTTGATEKSLAAVRTPLYLVAATPAGKLKPGPVVVKMRQHYEDLVLRVIYLPLFTHDDVVAKIRRRAMLLEDGQEIHAVNTPFVENKGDQVGIDQLPFTGWSYFTSDDPRFHELAGMRCRKGGEPYVRLPLKDVLAGSTAYALALKDKSGDENTAAGGAAAVVYRYGRSIPGIKTSTSKGMRGGASPNFLAVRDVLANPKAALERRQDASQAVGKKSA